MWKKSKVTEVTGVDTKKIGKTKNKWVKWLILLLIILLIAILISLRSCNHSVKEPKEPNAPVATAADRDVAPNTVKVKSPEYKKYEKELNEQSEQASIMYTPSPILGGKNATGLLIWYPNIGDATYITIDIYAPNYKDPVYSSPLIPKDSAIQVDALTTKLPKGTYNCKVITTAIEEKNGKRVEKPNKPVSKIDITIAE